MATGFLQEGNFPEYEIKKFLKKSRRLASRNWKINCKQLQDFLKSTKVKFFDFPDNEMDGIHLLKSLKL